ncbi:UPL2 [Symbiodinium sp. CCMP2592]|nr:UPL2 [Symbiodinium sp. CCMP2592]
MPWTAPWSAWMTRRCQPRQRRSSAASPDNSQSPPKPLLNRLLPLIEAFFVLHGHADKAPRPEEPLQMTEGGSSRHVFAEFHEQSAAERSRIGQFCKKHRRQYCVR